MKTLRLALLTFVSLATTAPLHATSTDSQAAELQSQADALSKQLDQVPKATSSNRRQELASQHWRRMQEYLGSFPSMGCPMCGAMMGSVMIGGTGMHNGVTGGAMMQGPGMYGGMMGGGMMGCPMMGGDGNGWPMPMSMTPDSYHSAMAAQMRTMRELLAKAQSTSDPAERDRLMQEAWDGMYRNMQAMRGMGWMWMPADQARSALPEPTSQGARLENVYCSQCHAPPSPSLHTAAEWSAVASRMRGHMQDAGSSGQGLKIPTENEFDAIVDYLGKHAR